MEQIGKVSIWIGKVNSDKELLSFTLEKYNEDGDMSSLFMESFGIDYYDEQKKEVLFETSSNKERIFNQFSYAENFIDKIEDKRWIDFNGFILLYDYQYKGKIEKENNFYFIGSYDYV